jgi:hypothetical protein
MSDDQEETLEQESSDDVQEPPEPEPDHQYVASHEGGGWVRNPHATNLTDPPRRSR